MNFLCNAPKLLQRVNDGSAHFRRFCEEGRLGGALEALALIQLGTGLYLEACICILQGCIKLKSVEGGKQVHAHLIKHVPMPNMAVWNTLINMYAKCGYMDEAFQVFSGLDMPDVFIWTAIIAGFAQHGDGFAALHLFERMQLEGVKPDRVTFATIITACRNVMATEDGKRIHASILKTRCESDVFLGNTLIDMYAKCGNLDCARAMFDHLPARDVVSWNALIAAYDRHGQSIQALQLFNQMQEEGQTPSNITFVSAISACSNTASLEQGKRIHSYVQQIGCLSNPYIGNAILDMYCKCGKVEDVSYVFDTLPFRNVVTWNSIIAAYSQDGESKFPFCLCIAMEQEGLEPNTVTFIIILGASANISFQGHGKLSHAQILKARCESDTYVRSAILDMYCKSGNLGDAQNFFHRLHAWDIVLCNAMISGYAHNGDAKRALRLFKEMQSNCSIPDKVTQVSILNACSTIPALEHGKWVHASILKTKLVLDSFIYSSLLDMYTKCGCICSCRSVFDTLDRHDIVIWNCIITGYFQHGHSMEVLDCFQQMQEEGVEPNDVTLFNILNACAILSALESGKYAHAYLEKSGWASFAYVASALVAMYANCGKIEDAYEVFCRLHARETVLWSNIIAGYAQHGHANVALSLFKEMQLEGVEPNEVTFTSVISACSHAGFINEGCFLFSLISEGHGILPALPHYCSLIDLLGRSGYMSESEDLINMMPSEPIVVSWTSIIGAV